MRQLRTLPPPFLVVLIASSLLAAGQLLSTGYALLHPGILPGLADKDFANYWLAGKLILEGRTADLFGPQPIYFAHLRDIFGPLFPWHNWSYPPHYLLLVWPLGFFGYKMAMTIFLVLTGAFFVWGLRAFAGRDNIMALVAAGPFMVHNFWVAQNGYLFAGLALGVLALRDKRPIIAGILLGLLTIKPQLGILFPFLLLAERRWIVIASAAATTVALVASSAAIFGVSAWEGYIREVLPYQAFVMRALEGTFLAMLPSAYGMLRDWGVGPDAALIGHCVLAVPAFLVCMAAFFRLRDGRARSVVLLVGTFLITPYALTYDLGLLVGGLALLPALCLERRPLRHSEQVLLSIAMFLPVVMMTLGQLYVPIAPAVLTAVFIVALSRFDFGLEGLKRSRQSSRMEKPTAWTSPAAASD